MIVNLYDNRRHSVDGAGRLSRARGSFTPRETPSIERWSSGSSARGIPPNVPQLTRLKEIQMKQGGKSEEFRPFSARQRLQTVPSQVCPPTRFALPAAAQDALPLTIFLCTAHPDAPCRRMSTAIPTPRHPAPQGSRPFGLPQQATCVQVAPPLHRDHACPPMAIPGRKGVVADLRQQAGSRFRQGLDIRMR